MKKIAHIDSQLIAWMRRISIPFGRFALFVVYFWFGILKIIGTSPANPMVKDLMETTLPFMTFDQFIIGFAVYEMIIGIAFLIPRFNRLAIILIIPHMVMTSLPLFFLSAMTWQGFLTPTIEGQYIIKNLIIIAVAMGIWAHLLSCKQTSDTHSNQQS